jgi:hypothetical protein
VLTLTISQDVSIAANALSLKEAIKDFARAALQKNIKRKNGRMTRKA